MGRGHAECRRGEKKSNIAMNIQDRERDVLKKKSSFCSWEDPPFKAALSR